MVQEENKKTYSTGKIIGITIAIIILILIILSFFQYNMTTAILDIIGGIFKIFK